MFADESFSHKIVRLNPFICIRVTLPSCIPNYGTLSVKGAKQTMNFPQLEQLLTKRCPLCASTTTTPFLRRSGVPVLTNLLIASQKVAQQVQRGDIFIL